ncbi:uncharacterized protein LOC62_01G001538 [Vanrija pseudolonga]|uniref:Uncharacterized protein n=1 Tax=Vanrija pseudolonga TaxID=143232 RepID=A0AAF0Y5D4_9TREE|nr:hypothetical protein LOC62_01G001538 [Vanrija pseudolonga]
MSTTTTTKTTTTTTTTLTFHPSTLDSRPTQVLADPFSANRSAMSSAGPLRPSPRGAARWVQKAGYATLALSLAPFVVIGILVRALSQPFNAMYEAYLARHRAARREKSRRKGRSASFTGGFQAFAVENARREAKAGAGGGANGHVANGNGASRTASPVEQDLWRKRKNSAAPTS